MDVPSINPYLKTIEFICLKRFYYSEDGHKFFVYVLNKLKENNFYRIKQFKGRSSFKTFLISITNRLIIDFYRKRHGRPSKDIKIRNNGNPGSNRAQFTVFSQEGMPEAVDCGALPDELAAQMESAKIKQKMAKIVRSLSADLSHEDRLILKMKYYDNHKVSEIAKILQLDQRALYRRLSSHWLTVKVNKVVNVHDLYFCAFCAFLRPLQIHQLIIKKCKPANERCQKHEDQISNFNLSYYKKRRTS